jgi:hypothetical protein
MTKEQVKEILERVLTWPPERQEHAARMLSEMEAQETSPYHLSDEQVAAPGCFPRSPCGIGLSGGTCFP